MVFVFLQIRCKFSDGVHFTVSTSVRRETGSARQNNSVKSGTKILPSCEQTRTHCRWFECRKVWCHKYNWWTKIISDTLSSVTRFLKLYRSYLLQDGKSKLIPPHLPQTMLCHATCSYKRVNIGWGGGGGGGWSRLYVFPNSPFGDSVCGERFFGQIVGYAWVVLNRNACQLVVTNVSTTCADVIITAIVTDTHPVAVYVFCVFFTNAILSSPFSWPTAWLDRTPISSYP